MRIISAIALTAAMLTVVAAGCASRPVADPTAYCRATVAPEDAAIVRAVGPWFVWPWRDPLRCYIDEVDGTPRAPAAAANSPPRSAAA